MLNANTNTNTKQQAHQHVNFPSFTWKRSLCVGMQVYRIQWNNAIHWPLWKSYMDYHSSG